MVQIDRSFEQLASALRRLPTGEKIQLWRLLDQDIDRSAISQNFAQALESIRAAHQDISENEVMADILEVQQEVRSSRRNDG